MKIQLLFFILIFLPMMAKADDSGSCGDNVSYTYNDATQTLTISGTGRMNYYESGNTSWPWSGYSRQIQKVIIENGVKSIGAYAFFGCGNLTSVTISNSVKSIGYWAFCGCFNLTSVTIPSKVKSISWNAFCGCTSLTSVTIPSSVESIRSQAFDGCSNLTSVYISDLEAWCKISFEDYTSNPLIFKGHLYLNDEEIKDLTIPRNIGKYAFSGCSGLTSVTIPSSVTYIGLSAFDGCSGLESITVDSNNMTYDSRDNCNAIIETSTNALVAGCKNTVIPNSVTSIGDYAFSGCKGLTSITIPDKAISIGNYAFSGCEGLTSMTIGNNVASIGEKAFQGCSKLCSLVIPNSITTIGDHSFLFCSGLTDVTIGNNDVDNNATTIGYCAFSNCGGITSLTIGNNVTTIENQAFSCCSNLIQVTIPASISSIGNGAFSYCNGLKNIIVDSNNTTYDSRDNCNAIIETSTNTLVAGCKKTVIPNSVTSIGDAAFCGCSDLTSMSIPNSVISIGASAFVWCENLASVTIGNSVETIGGGAFDGCNLTEVISKIKNPFNLDESSFKIFNDETYNNATLYVPAGTIDKYKATEGWKKFVYIEEGTPSSITGIDCEEVKEIRRYTLDGRITNNSHKGVYIIKMSDGKTRKVLVK